MQFEEEGCCAPGVFENIASRLSLAREKIGGHKVCILDDVLIYVCVCVLDDRARSQRSVPAVCAAQIAYILETRRAIAL